MATLARIIDAVGGMDIFLEQDVDGRFPDGSEGFGYFYAGEQHLSGDAAIRFSRIRFQDSDDKRIDRQTQVLYALLDKFLSPPVLSKIPKIISSFRDSAKTYLSPKDNSSLTCLLPFITKEKLVNSRLPEHMPSGSWQLDPHLERDTWVWFADFESFCEIIHKFQEGTWSAN